VPPERHGVRLPNGRASAPSKGGRHWIADKVRVTVGTFRHAREVHMSTYFTLPALSSLSQIAAINKQCTSGGDRTR